MKYKLFLIFVIGLFVIGNVSAFEFDNVKNYDEKTKTVEIKNAFGLGHKLLELQLTSPQMNYVSAGKDVMVAEFLLKGWSKHDSLFDLIRTYDIKNDYKENKYDFTLKYGVDYYEEECHDLKEFDLELGESAFFCDDVQKTKWVDFKSLSELPHKNIKIGLFTETRAGNRVEWIPTIQGVDVEEWAAWDVTSGTSCEFDTSDGAFNSLIKVDSTHYLNTWGTTNHYAVILTVNVSDMSVSNGSKYNYETGAAGNFGSIVGIDSTHFLKIYQGLDHDMFAVVLTVNTGNWSVSNGTKHEFDPISGRPNSVVKIDSTHYLVTYSRDSDAYAVVLTVNTGDWTITNSTPYGFYSPMHYPSLVQIDSTHYLNTYAGEGDDGYAVVLEVNTGTWDVTNYTPFEFDTVYAFRNSLTQIDSTHYLNTYSGEGSDGYAVVLNVNETDWTVTKNTPLEFDTSAGDFHSVTQIDSTHYLNTYSGEGSDGYAVVLNVNETDWTISNDTPQVFDSGVASHNSLVQIDLVHYLNTYSGVDSDGYAVVIQVDVPSYVILNSPDDSYASTNQTVIFNGSVYDYCDDIVNVSLIIDGVYTETNSSGVNNTDYIFTKIVSDGIHNWTYEVCNDRNTCVNTTFREFDIERYFENLLVYNLYSHETKQETYAINITTDGNVPTSGKLVYNGTSYDATITNLEGNNYNISKEITLLNSPGNKTFYFNFTLSGVENKTTTQYQIVNNTLLGICNATLTVPYINFTFVDEETLANINATIDTSSWTYWIGDGTVTKSLLFSNTTAHNTYAFCFSASNDTMKNTRSLQYASPGYPQRKYDASGDLTNATTNKTLYLLSSADGIYSTIQVVDTQSNRVSGVEVTAERQFSGIWTVVGQETTDDAGAVTFWVNPDYDHRLTFVSDDCTGTTVTVRPTQTQYTQELICGITIDYVSTIEGLKYARTPKGGIIQPGVYNFTYTLVSAKDNIVNASFYIVNSSSGGVLNSTVSNCASGGCTIFFTYNITKGEDVKGKYYVDVGNGSILLEGDAWWKCIYIPSEGRAGIKSFFQDIIFIFQEWGDDSSTADFNRLVFVFFILCVCISVLNHHFNMDTMNPGAFLVGFTLFVFIGSIVGGTDAQGLFYFNNLKTTGSDVTQQFVNNYLLVFICFVITISYFINANRQAQR